MSYVQKSLLPDEKILFTGSLHWIVFVPGLALVIVAGLLAAYGQIPLAFVFGKNLAAQMKTIQGGLAAAALLAGLTMMLGGYIRQQTTELAITNRRIIAKYGFIARSTFEIMLNRITGANFDQTVPGRMMGYGTIIVHGAGGDISPFDLIGDPQTFHRVLVGVLEQQNAVRKD